LKEQINKKITCNSIDDLPPIITYLKNAERGITFFILFKKRNILYKNKKKAIVKTLNHYKDIFKSNLPDYFMISAIDESNSIRIEKLITDTEITENKIFFEKCAQDYNRLANELMEQFQKTFKTKPYNDVPLRTINSYDESFHGSRGTMGNWYYGFHGFELRFIHKITCQEVEIFLNYGGEFGVLDPQFFVDYIKSSDEYRPLPVKLLSSFHDGYRILKVMTELGSFEKIHSNFSVELTREIIKNRDKKFIQIVNQQEFYEDVMFKN